MENIRAADAEAIATTDSEKRSSDSQQSSKTACGKRAFAPLPQGATDDAESPSHSSSPSKKRRCSEKRLSGKEEKTSESEENGESGGDEEDDEDFIILENPPEQQASADKRENPSTKPDARRIIVEAILARVERLGQSAPQPSPSIANSGSGSDLNSLSWTTRVWQQLGVSGSMETTQLMVTACDRVAEWLRHHPNSDSDKESMENFKRKRRCASALVEILSLLPRVDNNDELVRHNMYYVVTNNSTIQTQLWCYPKPFAQVDDEPGFPDPNSFLEQPSARSSSARERSQVATATADRITSECSSLLERMERLEGEHRANDEYRMLVLQTLNRRTHRTAKKLSRSVFRLASCEKARDHARHVNELSALQICRLILEYSDQLFARGETSASAEINAFEYIMRCSDTNISWQRYLRAQSAKNLRRAMYRHARAQVKLAKHQSLVELMTHVKQRRERSLKMTAEVYASSHQAFTERAYQALTECVPLLARALQTRFDFLSTQRAKAQHIEIKKVRELETRMDYFGSEAPINQREMELAICELQAVREKATTTMQAIAEAQCHLWEDRKDLLPSSVWDLVMGEYAALCGQLSQPVHEVLRTFFVRVGLQNRRTGDATMRVHTSQRLLRAPATVSRAAETAITAVQRIGTTTVTTTIVREEVVREEPAPEPVTLSGDKDQRESDEAVLEEMDDEGETSEGYDKKYDAEINTNPSGMSCSLM